MTIRQVGRSNAAEHRKRIPAQYTVQWSLQPTHHHGRSQATPLDLHLALLTWSVALFPEVQHSVMLQMDLQSAGAFRHLYYMY